MRVACIKGLTVHAVLVRRLHVLVQIDEALEERVIGRIRREVAVILHREGQWQGIRREGQWQGIRREGQQQWHGIRTHSAALSASTRREAAVAGHTHALSSSVRLHSEAPT